MKTNLVVTRLFNQNTHIQFANKLILSGTRIGQASECFVYWKDPATNDTWGLNFTSAIDAKQFCECCVSNLFKLISKVS